MPSSITTDNQLSSGGSRPIKAPAPDYNTFLQLLIAQLKNQDPSNPVSASESISQLATFSQVEKTVEMASKLDDLIVASQFSKAQDMIGRHVVPADGSEGGVVVSAMILSGNVAVTLDNGRQLNISPGVVIRSA